MSQKCSFVEYRETYLNAGRAEGDLSWGKFVCTPPFYPQVEYLAYICTNPSKAEMVLIVGHRVLGERGSDSKFSFTGQRETHLNGGEILITGHRVLGKHGSG